MSSRRYEVDGVALHAGFPVDVIKPDGSVFETRIESDSDGWYLVGWPDRSIGGLTVKPLV